MFLYALNLSVNENKHAWNCLVSLNSLYCYRKITFTTSLRKARRRRDSSPSSLLIRYNTYAPWRTTSTILTNGDHHHFFHSDNITILGRIFIHSVDKTNVLVVTKELIWLLFLNILSFNFFLTPSKSLRFTRFRRNYINCSADWNVQRKRCEIAIYKYIKTKSWS